MSLADYHDYSPLLEPLSKGLSHCEDSGLPHSAVEDHPDSHEEPRFLRDSSIQAVRWRVTQQRVAVLLIGGLQRHFGHRRRDVRDLHVHPVQPQSRVSTGLQLQRLSRRRTFRRLFALFALG
jgi:hypothetical protein